MALQGSRVGGRSPASENVFKKAIVVYFLEIQDISITLRKGVGGTDLMSSLTGILIWNTGKWLIGNRDLS